MSSWRRRVAPSLFSGATLFSRVASARCDALVDERLAREPAEPCLPVDSAVMSPASQDASNGGATLAESASDVVTVRGRTFGADEIEAIRAIIVVSPSAHRSELSRRICVALDWRQANGRLKDRSCRDVLLRLEAKGWITLPARRRAPVHRRAIVFTPRTAPRPPVAVTPREVNEACFSVVTGSGVREESLWNEYVARYHPLGYGLSLGAHLKYFVRWRGELIACLAFGGAAWTLEARDRWIGWTPEARREHLAKVVNNTRYLILPWAQRRNLASRILGLVAGRLGDDWWVRYGYRPVLLETFVDASRHRGSCYRAANWQWIGLTKGRGRMDRRFRAAQPRKGVLVYPLVPEAKLILCGRAVGGSWCRGGAS
jgi:hypothetical protein